ncbi:SPASM domain-containing protein [Fusibacter sp. JL298sf-3]
MYTDSSENIYKSIGEEKEIIGTVKDYLNDKMSIENSVHQKWLDSSYDSNCSNCEVLPLCHSGCIYKRFETNEPSLCMNRKGTFKKILKITHEEIERSI